MTKWLKGALALCIALSIVSCATKQTAIPFDRSANSIKTIGIIDPYIPERANVVLVGTVGQNMAAAGGLIGALIGGAIDESMRANRVRKFDTLATTQKFSAREQFLASLEKALQSQGYNMVIVPVDRKNGKVASSKPVGHAADSADEEDETAEAPADFRKTYPPGIDAGVDAYLDILVENYGYMAAGIGSAPYRPFIGIRCRLVDANTRAVLMEDMIAYNPLGQPKDTVIVSAGQDYAYNDFDTLMAAGPKATEGLSVAFGQTADTLANLLR